MSVKLRLRKLEARLESLGYHIRYEKGQFNAGACIVKDKKIIVVNRYLTEEGRFESLLNISSQLDLSGMSSASSAESNNPLFS